MSSALNREGDRLAIGDLAGKVQIWKITNEGGEKISDFADEENPAALLGPSHYGQGSPPYRSGYIGALAFSPDGKLLAVGSSVIGGEARQQLRVWDTTSLSVVRSYDTGTQRQAISSVSYSPNGRFIATAGAPMAVRIWDASSPSLVKEIVSGGRAWDVVAFSPDGRKIAYGGEAEVYIASIGQTAN
jgi:WD40 repeat protein